MKICKNCGIKVPIPDSGPMRCPICADFIERRKETMSCPNCKNPVYMPREGKSEECPYCKEIIKV